MSVNLQGFADKLFSAAKAAGFTEYEIYYAAGTTETYRVYGGEIAEYKSAGADGLSFRGMYGGKMGYASSEHIAEDVIPFLINSAKQNAEIIDSEDAEVLYAGDAVYPAVCTYNEALDAVSSETKAKAALEMEHVALQTDARVKGVSYCLLTNGEGSVYIANSKGLQLSHNGNYAMAYVVPNVEENGVVQTGFEIFAGNEWKDFHPAEIAERAVARAVSKLNAATVKSGTYDILFHQEAMVDLLDTFAGVFSADNVQKGFSLLAGKLGEAVASEAVTIRDDALLENALGSAPFDSEGVAAKNKVVVERGVLKTYLHNTKTAAKDGIPSTGNGFKASFRAAVGIQPTNFYIVPSETPYEALVERLGNGLVIVELEGLHAGANEISGDFSLSAKGFRIENGAVGGAVEQITIAGNFFAVLKQIEAVGIDFRFGMPGGGNIGAPSAIVRGMSVSGN